MNETTTPTARRHAAITELVDRHSAVLDPTSAEELAAAVEGLAALGRSEKWKHAIAAWAGLFTAHPDALGWALVQGAVWACNAA
jgi:hypothetical protein